MAYLKKWIFLLHIIYFIVTVGNADSAEKGEDQKEKWKKKDITDYNDADMERLFEQWEVWSPMGVSHI